MNLKPLLIALLLPLACSQKINSQDWNEFANTSRYDKANLELKLHTTAHNRVVFMGNSITEDWLKIRPEFFLTILLLIEGLVVKLHLKCLLGLSLMLLI